MSRFFWYFLFYSFLGFLLEVAFARVTGAAKRDRKCFLLLPLCPVYGLGALAILALPGWVGARWWLLWLVGGGACTAAEYLMALFYEEALGVRFWSYRGLWGNVQGRVCPLFALMWGGLAVGLRYGVHPLVAPALAAIPPGLVLPGVALVVLDSWATLALLSRAGDTRCLRWYDRALRAFPAPAGCPPPRAGGGSPPPEPGAGPG